VISFYLMASRSARNDKSSILANRRKIAWRDLWSGRRHFAVALTTLAVGVGAMSAARVVASEFTRRLSGDMRQWIAADVAVTLRQPLPKNSAAR